MFANILRAQPKLSIPHLTKPGALLRHYIPANSAIPVKPQTEKEDPTWLSPSKRTLFVRGIDSAATAEDLRGVFSRYGPIKQVVLPKNDDGTHRNFAYVEFTRLDDAVNAYEWCNVEKVWLYSGVLNVRWDNLMRNRRQGLVHKRKERETGQGEMRPLTRKSSDSPTS